MTSLRKLGYSRRAKAVRSRHPEGSSRSVRRRGGHGAPTQAGSFTRDIEYRSRVARCGSGAVRDTGYLY